MLYLARVFRGALHPARPLIRNVVEVGDLNIINDPGNPSDGLRYLDMSYSDGLTQAAALTRAQLAYPNARLAVPSEFDDLIAAAGILYDGSLTASDGFEVGANTLLSSGSNYDGAALRDQLGLTGISATLIWTLPDGDDSDTTTRDLLRLDQNSLDARQTAFNPPNTRYGWLLVSEANAAVPEPATSLPLLTLLASLAWVRRRKK